MALRVAREQRRAAQAAGSDKGDDKVDGFSRTNSGSKQRTVDDADYRRALRIFALHIKTSLEDVNTRGRAKLDEIVQAMSTSDPHTSSSNKKKSTRRSSSKIKLQADTLISHFKEIKPIFEIAYRNLLDVRYHEFYSRNVILDAF